MAKRWVWGQRFIWLESNYRIDGAWAFADMSEGNQLAGGFEWSNASSLTEAQHRSRTWAVVPRTGASSPRPLYLTECLLIGPKENAA